MSMQIIFEAHATTFDNEAKIASGWNDAELSPKGEAEAGDLGKRYVKDPPEVIFCADRQRGYRTAYLAFPDFPSERLFMDWRLRECDYGDLEHADNAVITAEKINRIQEPFPNGESYESAMARMQSFLDDLRKMPFKRILVIGSRATHYGLEHWLNHKPLEELVVTPFKWQPGWHFEM
jgi:broad specificity phosphatase PhoE